jgi:hypothetical protein
MARREPIPAIHSIPAMSHPFEIHLLARSGQRMPDPTNAADKDLANACREWIKGCSCAPSDSPQECKECTDAFLTAVLTRAKNHGLKIGANAI